MDPVNTTSSILKAKRPGLPRVAPTAGISSANVATKKSRNSYENIYIGARIFSGIKKLSRLIDGLSQVTFSLDIDD